MNNKILVAIAIMAITLATAKTGYAFYEKQNNQIENVENIKVNQIAVNKDNQNIVQTETSYVEENSADSTVSGQTSNCCGGSFGSMLDENGNLKDRDTFEKELDGSVASGDITEEDKEYYLFMYDKCAAAYAKSDSGADNEGSSTPSCH
jgi:hypothetical protein